MSELLTTKQVARILGKSRHDVARFATEGHLAFVQLPGATYRKFTRQAVEDFIRRCEVGPKLAPVDQDSMGQDVQKLAPSRQGQNTKSSEKVEWYERLARK